MTGSRREALARLDVFVGEWAVEATFPAGRTAPAGRTGGGVLARSRFDWALDRQFLLQRTEIPIPEAPDSLAIVGADPQTGAYTQHYFDSRGVARLYAMSLTDRVWTLTREAADFSPLDFGQRFVGTFNEDGDTVAGAWEIRLPDGDWEHDFDLVYRKVG